MKEESLSKKLEEQIARYRNSNQFTKAYALDVFTTTIARAVLGLKMEFCIGGDCVTTNKGNHLCGYCERINKRFGDKLSSLTGSEVEDGQD